MFVNEYGIIVREEWFRSADIRREIELSGDEFVVVPNHIHGIVWIVEPTIGTTNVRATGRSPLPPITVPAPTFQGILLLPKGGIYVCSQSDRNQCYFGNEF
jgi:hypothetical protein